MFLEREKSGISNNLPISGVQGRSWSVAFSLIIHGVIFAFLGSLILISGAVVPQGSFKAVLEESASVPIEEENIQVEAPAELPEEEAAGGTAAPAPAVTSFVVLEPEAAVSSSQFLPSLPGGMSSHFSGVFGGQGIGGGTGIDGSGGAGKERSRLKSSEIFGMELIARNEGLLVFLDNSGSMLEASKRMRALVSGEFPQATLFNLRGALFAEEKSIEKLKKERKGDDYIVAYYRTMLNSSIIPKCHEVLDTLTNPPEAIYMMSDFKDYVDPQVVDDFGRWLVSKKIRFYAHSMGERPPSAVITLCRQTGGAVLMVPLEKLPLVQEETSGTVSLAK